MSSITFVMLPSKNNSSSHEFAKVTMRNIVNSFMSQLWWKQPFPRCHSYDSTAPRYV